MPEDKRQGWIAELKAGDQVVVAHQWYGKRTPEAVQELRRLRLLGWLKKGEP